MQTCESVGFDLNTYMTIGKTATSLIHLDTHVVRSRVTFPTCERVFSHGKTLLPWITNHLSLDASQLDCVMMNRSLCDVTSRSVGTCATCGHILSQSRSNFNSINPKQGAASDNGGEKRSSQYKFSYKRDCSR